MGLYGRIEHSYCEPVAEGLASDVGFAQFFIERAGRTDWARAFRCLKAEQAALRTSGQFWWKNVYCSESRCLCPNLRGREIDILAVFERSDGARLGLHIECKRPGDRFSPGQAERYRERVACWTQNGRGPRTIPPHSEASAILICERDHRHAAADVVCFDGVVFFDEIKARAPAYPDPGRL
jgi:hypothetical protein